tara:strand:+ start:410 stop:787 length:378 start_codon:yes stop_codon:yes gene_type:complete
MFFSTSPLPFCRQLINNKQSGDIEVSFTNKVGKIKKDIKSSSDKEKIEELELKLAMLIAQANQDEQGGKAVSGADLERARQSVKGKRTKTSGGYSNIAKKGGGKIYASTDKKYGGGIYPRKPTNG